MKNQYSNDRLLEIFESNLVARGLKSRSSKALVSRVHGFLKYLDAMNISVLTLTVENCWEYQNFLLSKKNSQILSSDSVAVYMGVAKRFLTVLRKEKIIISNPFESLEVFRKQRKLPHGIFKPEEMTVFLEKLLDWDDSPENLRLRKAKYKYHIMGEVQYSTGLRIRELLSITQDDLDFEKGIVYIKREKGGEHGTAFLNSYAIEVLKLYLEIRHLILDKTDAEKKELFGSEWAISKYNDRLSSISSKMEKGKFHSHLFRHAFGSHLLKAGCSLRFIQALLGHRKISSTEVYTRLDAEDTRKILDTFHPLG